MNTMISRMTMFGSQAFILIIILSVLIKDNTAFTTQYYGNAKHPVKSKHCYYDELDATIPQNQTIYPINIENTCVWIKCREDYVLVIQHCDRIMLQRGCIATSHDYTKPYPNCCPQIKCI